MSKADDVTLCAYLVSGNEAVEAGARAKIDHAFASLEIALRKRICDSREGFNRFIGQRIDNPRVIAQAGRQQSSRMKVILVVRFDRYVSVFLLDLLSECCSIDRRIAQYHLPLAQ